MLDIYSCEYDVDILFMLIRCGYVSTAISDRTLISIHGNTIWIFINIDTTLISIHGNMSWLLSTRIRCGYLFMLIRCGYVSTVIELSFLFMEICLEIRLSFRFPEKRFGYVCLEIRLLFYFQK